MELERYNAGWLRRSQRRRIFAPEARDRVVESLDVLLADVFALYLKTKNFHWHMVGSHFRDYHLLLDEHADQIFAATDVLAERVRKIGGATIRSIGHIARLQTIADDDAGQHSALEGLRILCADNQRYTRELRQAHAACDDAVDVATASLLENFIDESERRTWFTQPRDLVIQIFGCDKELGVVV